MYFFLFYLNNYMWERKHRRAWKSLLLWDFRKTADTSSLGFWWRTISYQKDTQWSAYLRQGPAVRLMKAHFNSLDPDLDLYQIAHTPLNVSDSLYQDPWFSFWEINCKSWNVYRQVKRNCSIHPQMCTNKFMSTSLFLIHTPPLHEDSWKSDL